MSLVSLDRCLCVIAFSICNTAEKDVCGLNGGIPCGDEHSRQTRKLATTARRSHVVEGIRWDVVVV